MKIRTGRRAPGSLIPFQLLLIQVASCSSISRLGKQGLRDETLMECHWYGFFRPDSVEDQQTKSAMFSFLSWWLQKLPQDFCESPGMVAMRQLLDYSRLTVPSEEVDTQARELLSVLEEQEAKHSKLEKGCTTPEPPVQEASGMQETLALWTASVAEPQGDLQPGEDPALMELAVLEPFVSEAGPG